VRLVVACAVNAEVRALAFRETLAILQQRPARAVEAGIGLLFAAAGFIEGFGGVGHDMVFIEGYAGLWERRDCFDISVRFYYFDLCPKL
jgi:hypothetical protein